MIHSLPLILRSNWDKCYRNVQKYTLSEMQQIMSPPGKKNEQRRCTDDILNYFLVCLAVRSNCILFDRNLGGRSPSLWHNGSPWVTTDFICSFVTFFLYIITELQYNIYIVWLRYIRQQDWTRATRRVKIVTKIK